MTFPDFRAAPNQGSRPDLYEIENRGVDPGGLLRAAAPAAVQDRAQGQADVTDAWWAARGAVRTEVMSRWEFGSRGDLEAVLRLEFPADVAGAWLAEHPVAVGLSYGYVLFALTRR